MSAVPKKTAVAWAQFTATVAQMEAKDVRGNASKMIRLAVEAGYEEHLKENYPNYQSRLEDLEQLAVFARQFETIEDFLTQLALLTNVEAEDDQAANRDDEQLKLSTIHQAKGLEFDVVFVIMLCDGMFPSARSLESQEGEEEERRLMYVAITRARNGLYLSYPLIRATGNTGRYDAATVAFLGGDSEGVDRGVEFADGNAMRCCVGRNEICERWRNNWAGEIVLNTTVRTV